MPNPNSQLTIFNPKKTVICYSLDYDGSFAFNTTHHERVDPREKEKVVALTIRENAAFLNSIRRDKCDKQVFFVGSNRQDLIAEAKNAYGNGNGFAFDTIQKIAENYLAAEFNPFLLGTLLECEGQYFVYDDKVPMVYAQMHTAAQQYPNDNIIFRFNDDKDAILQDLEDFFTENPDLIPANVTLEINSYDRRNSPLPVKRASIQGMGKIDNDIYATLVKINQLTAEPADKYVGRYCKFGKPVTSTADEKSPDYIARRKKVCALSLFAHVDVEEVKATDMTNLDGVSKKIPMCSLEDDSL